MKGVIYVQHNHFPQYRLQIRQNVAIRQAAQDTNLPHSASNGPHNVTHLCLTEWRNKWKCWQGKLTLGAPCPARQVMFLEPGLHPV